ncbi:MAG: hypothetical protein OXI79_18290 [Gammaproteobacteria bacterium]|nr:hypothetical protein [Gammaproteobacteria bacterium]
MRSTAHVRNAASSLSSTLLRGPSMSVRGARGFAVGTLVLQAGLVVAETNHTVPLFPSASDATRQGFVRVINHSVLDGEVRILAVDDSGGRVDPITLGVDGRETVHFNSDDLELGNDGKGLSGGVGSGEGDWRLELTSGLDIEVMAYIRTTDGFLTAMHDTVPGTDNRHEVAIFNPASNRDQISRLRIVNPGESDAGVTITGVDSTGASPGDAVAASVAAGASLTLTAEELESDGLGDGAGKWRLNVESDQPVVVVNLLESPTGHLTNLSTTIGSRRVPLFPSASGTRGQGFVRVLNPSDEAGVASVAAFDDTGRAYDPVMLDLGAGETAYFNSDDLEQGNTAKGLSGRTGTGEGDWRLEFSSDLDIEVSAYVRTEDGFLTAIHDSAPGTAYRSRVPTFNPGSNVDQVSRLRLVNVGTSPADVRIQGIDGLGEWSSTVQVSLPAGAARDLSARELESGGEGFAGMLGNGAGKWQLIIRSDQPLVAMSLLESPTGHLTNLSAVPVDRSAKVFEHRQSFRRFAEDSFYSNEEWYFDQQRGWYAANYELARYTGFQDLLKKHDYHLPTGRGLTVLQAERNHTPDDLGDVRHLFVYKDSDRHSRTVAEILTEYSDYPLLLTRHTTFSFELDSFHTTDTADLRAFAGDEDRTRRYPSLTHDGVPIAPAKLLNVSNTNGGSSVNILRHFDKFVEENDLVACTAQSSLIEGNWTTSGMAYNSIVVDQKYGNPNAFDGAKVNDHGSPRYKPDIMARAKAAATSYSSPLACSAAAMLLERAQLDPLLSNAYHGIAIKAILMAGATRFNYRASAEWADVSPIDPLFWHGEWERTSDELPLSPRYGAGALNVLAAYDILDAGEFDGEADVAVGPRGWDYGRDPVEGDVVAYSFDVARESVFSAVLVWHRYIDDDWTSYLPDYELEVIDGGGGRVAFSNSATSNVELVEATLQPGSYVMEVRAASDGGSPHELTYGLAWTTKAICAAPEGLRVEGDDESWTLEWDEPADVQCRKYRLQARAGDDESEAVEEDLYLDLNTHTYAKPDDASARHFRVYAYPNDGDVAYRYPSSPTRIVGDP